MAGLIMDLLRLHTHAVICSVIALHEGSNEASLLSHGFQGSGGRECLG